LRRLKVGSKAQKGNLRPQERMAGWNPSFVSGERGGVKVTACFHENEKKRGEG